MTARRWYVAKTRSGQDQIAVENLARQSFAAFYPTVQIERQRRQRITRSIEGLFPGYVFVNFALDDTRWRAINSTRGIASLLSFSKDGTPSPVKRGEVEHLQAEEKAGKFELAFRVGDTVRARNQSVFSPTGRVIAAQGDRIEFLLQLLGRDVKCIAASSALYVVVAAPVR